MIPYGRQNINDDDIAAVVDVLQSDFLTQGPKVPEFEAAIAKYCGARHAVAVNSGTSALHIACLALGLEGGDWLWTSPNSFVASANCALYCAAKVDFVDIDKHGNMCSQALTNKLEYAEKHGLLPKVVVPVHFAGHACDMAEIRRLSDRYGFKVLEDASHAIGASYLQQKVGACTYSDITVFSFHPVKIITTGEGGLATTNDSALAESMAQLRSHGITRDTTLMEHKSHGPWYYEQLQLGFNYRMTDMAAALGTQQLTRVDALVEKRRILKQRYDTLLSDLPITLPQEQHGVHASWHLYVVQLRLEDINVSRRDVFDSMRASGIGVNVHYIPIYRQPYFQRTTGNTVSLPNMEHYYERALTIPLFPDLSSEDMDAVVKALTASLRRC